ncbi:MAG: hypothetical protein V4563_17000, partial [Pseudomonadota bacterium]
AIIDEFNRRKAQAGQGIGDLLGLQKKPADWFSQMQQTQQNILPSNTARNPAPLPQTYEGRPVVRNPDGSWSHERSMTIEADGRHMNIPTMFGGKQVDPDKAVEIMRANKWVDPDTGKPVQTFSSQAEAVAAAQQKEAAQQQMPQGGPSASLTPPKKPADWFQQMQQGQNAVVTPEQRSNVNKELADMLERFTAGVVPPMIRERERAMQTDPSAAAKPFTSEEIKQAAPFVTAAAPIAYHGTPHTFDKFDASKIGTGEGAQAYGHGIYFAEHPDVAKEYAGRLATPQMTFGGKSVNELKGISPEAKSVAETLNSQLTSRGWQDRKSFIDEVKSRPWVKAQLNELGELGVKETGNMYQVNIPDQHAARMLDFNKPINEQTPEVQKMLFDAFPVLEGSKKTITAEFGGAINAAQAKLLKESGIPGIKYLDQGSRAGPMPGTKGFTAQWNKAGTGVEVVEKATGKVQAFPSFAAADAFIEKQPANLTRNFVVFDPAILEDVTRK